MDLKESVGMGDENMGPSTATAKKIHRKPLSPILEAGASSRAPTPKRPQSSTPAEVDRASRSKRPQAQQRYSLKRLTGWSEGG